MAVQILYDTSEGKEGKGTRGKGTRKQNGRIGVIWEE